MIRLEDIEKSFTTATSELRVLKGITLEIQKGELVAVTGPSGSGKSTLLAILGCLDRPTAGRYFFDGSEVAELSDDQETDLRNRAIGFVFQAFHLIPTLTIVENIEVPLLYAGVDRRERKGMAARALERVGLGDRLTHRPPELSGGEQQRVAIARALVRRPSLILADEPTGNLDSHTSGAIMALLKEVHEEGNTLILVTHDPEVAVHAQRRIHMIDGAISSDGSDVRLPGQGER